MPRGRPSQSPFHGKLADTWHYEYSGIVPEPEDDEPDEDDEPPAKKKPTVKPIKVEVELRLHKKFHDSQAPPMAVREVWFTVSCKNPRFEVEGSDIEALRAAMWEKLDKHYAVKWESYYLVEIRPERHYEGLSSGFTFSYKDVYKGTAWDDTLLLKQYRRSSDYKDQITPWPGEFLNKQGRVVACIPASKENKKSLEEFARRIEELQDILADRLKPENIFRTLELLMGNKLGLLPAAPATPAKKKAAGRIIEIEKEDDA